MEEIASPKWRKLQRVLPEPSGCEKSIADIPLNQYPYVIETNQRHKEEGVC